MKRLNKILLILIILNVIILIYFLVKNKKISNDIHNLNSEVYMVKEIEVE